MPEIDGVLKEWGDRLYYTKPKGRAAQATVCGHKPKKSATATGTGGGGKSPASIRRSLALTIKKAPEVMVKVTGGGKCMSKIKAHFDYISRNGDVPVENEAGQMIHGKEAVRELRDDWKLSADGATIPHEGGYRREAFNIVLSMPPGTDRDAVKSAARDFAAANFDKHQYVFAAHDDEKHPHVHLCVKAVGRDLTRLNPRKADLQQWRESFAEKLRQHGIEANATPRAVRGVTRRPVKQAVIGMRERGRVPLRDMERAALVESDVARGVTESPHDATARERRKKVLTNYAKVAGTLAQSEAPEDRRLAVAVAKYVQGFQQPKTAHTLALEKAAAIAKPAPDRGKDQGKDRT